MSMQFQFEQPADAEGSDLPYLTKPGFYHVFITAQDRAPMNFDKSKYLDGLGIEFTVLAGTHLDQYEKTFEETFIKGNVNQKDKGNFCNRKLFKLFSATCLIQQHVPGQQTTLDTELLLGRQCVIEVEEKPNSAMAKKPSGTHIEFKGDHVWHVDDPAVKDVPKHIKALERIPQELRRHPSSFKTDEGPGAAGAGSPAGQPGGPKPKLSVAQMLGAPAGAAATQVADVADV